MKLSWQSISLTTTLPFAISRWGYASHENVIVSVTDNDGLTGLGEAAPNKYYGETVASVIAALEIYTTVVVRADDWSLAAIEAELLLALRGNGSARAAISSALHDLYAKRLGISVAQLWGLDSTPRLTSSYTIGIADDEGLRSRIAAADPYPILKIKLGTDHDEAIVRTVREAAPGKILRVDANAAWSPKAAVRMAHVLHDEYGVESIEQPVVPQDLDGLRYVHKHSPIPVIADESCLVATDIPRLADACDGINIKLAKCGSLREAMHMVHVARAHNLHAMAGCMIETSVGISSIAQLSPLLDAADFDGAALLAHDPYSGVTIHNGLVQLSPTPGLGVTLRDA